MNEIKVVLVVVLCLLTGSVAFSPLYFTWGIGKWFYHDFMHWHQPRKNKMNTFDGASEHNHCKYCGKEIMQDSQGNWFTVSHTCGVKREGTDDGRT